MAKSPTTKMLMPTATELVGYVIGSIGLLFLIAVIPIYNNLLNPEESSTAGQVFSSHFNSAFRHLDQNQMLGTLTGTLIWAGIGTVCYLILWGLGNIYLSLRNDVVIGETFRIFGASGKDNSYWLVQMQRLLFRLSAIILTSLLTLAVVEVWYPVCAVLVRSWAYNWTSLVAWIGLTTALLIGAVIIYIYAVLFRLALLKVRVFK